MAEAGRDSAHCALCVSAALPQRASQRLQVRDAGARRGPLGASGVQKSE